MAAMKPGSIFSWEKESLMGGWDQEEEKSITIEYMSCSQTDEAYVMVFTVNAKNLKTNKATIIVEESELFFDELIGKPKVDINYNGSTNINLTMPKSFLKKLSNTWFERGEFEFVATIVCDGLTAKTREFKLKCITKEVEEKEEEKCLCKKEFWTAEDVKTIVTELRKGEVAIVNGRVVKDKNNHPVFKDKNCNIIQNDEKGNPIIKGGTIKKIDISEYELPEMRDKIFYIDKPEKLNLSNDGYADFAKELNNAFKKYKINNCILKVHFLAQAYQETQRFTLTYESNPSSSVAGGDFYRGRGLKQLTHDYNYLQYYDYIHGTTFYNRYKNQRNGFESVTHFNERTKNKFITVEEMKKVDGFIPLLSKNIFYACDSAGWY